MRPDTRLRDSRVGRPPENSRAPNRPGMGADRQSIPRSRSIGLITPPVGLNVYVLEGVAPDVSMGDMFRGCGWFVFVDRINVAILLAFPQIILFIPNTMIQ